MKKTLLLTLALLLSVTAFSQSNILLQETFDSEWPAGWTTSTVGAENWIISATDKAGGDPNEMQLTFMPIIFNGTTRLITPAINLSGIDEVVLSFRHCLDNQINTYTLGIATSTDGENWNTAWSEVYGDSGVFEVYELISTSDFGSENVYFSIFFVGSSFTMNGWYFDDITISTQDNIDMELVSIDVPAMSNYGEHEISFTVQNMGATAVTSFEAKFNNIADNNNVVTETFEANIESLDIQKFTFSQTIDIAPGTYTLPVEIVSVNGESDSDANNNALQKNINIGMGYASRIPMIEHFSSSTCGPCVSANQAMLEVTNNNPGKYTYTKYAVNRPGIGDPYYTKESGARVNYYQVGSAPQFYLDGQLQEYTVVTQEAIDATYGTPTFADIRGAFNVDGSTINITADFMSYIKLENVKAFISVNEKVTTGNVGSNGEKEFRHIMMKMLQTAMGNDISINAGEHQNLEFSFDMSETNMEDINDLEVALWLQNNETKEIYNSRFAYAYTDHSYPAQNINATVSDNADAVDIKWDAPEQGNPIGYSIRIDGEEIATHNADNRHYHSEDTELVGNMRDGKTHIAEVVAIYGNEMTSVSTAKVFERLWENVNENKEIVYNIYPNPAQDHIRISGRDIKTIVIYNCVGSMMEKIELNGDETTINTSNYNDGIYFVSITDKNGYSSTKKIVVTR